MKLIKVGAAVLNQTPRDWEGNYTNIVDAIEQARKENVTILCLPEMCITGYGLEDDLFCLDVPLRAMQFLHKIAQKTAGMIVTVGLPVTFNNALYNTVATIVNRSIIGFTCKQHLAGDGIHYEQRHFKPWPPGIFQQIATLEKLNSGLFAERIYLIGDIHFDIGGIKIGYEICEDAWVSNRPGTILASKGVDIYLNPSASHFAFDKLNTRKNFVVDGSRAFNATYIYANLLGNEAGRVIYDGGALIASGGKLLAVGERFSFKNFVLTTAVIDVQNTQTSQVRSASFQPDVESCNTGLVSYGFTYPTVTESVTQIATNESWETSPDIKHEECIRALGLALMDYMRKSHTKGFVISLSGGADSAMVTYACSKGIQMGIEELGLERFISKYCPHIKYFRDVPKAELIKEILKKLLTTAYQATENSGKVTKEAAFQIAKDLGTKHYEFDVQPVFNEYLKIATMVKGSELSFEENDITLQNLQARTRSPSIWILANMESKLLLTTSNMSEAAVGYATMDGDTSGCVAPIAGLSKIYIRTFLKWAQSDCRALWYINEQQPTAELRPAKYKQTDEDDLMPYDLLHKIESMVVKNRYVPVEVYKTLMSQGNYDNNKLIKDINKFFKLFSINQWKRERYALSFHMDDHNLDPRTWCRTPILTGGYKEELEELNKFLLT